MKTSETNNSTGKGRDSAHGRESTEREATARAAASQPTAQTEGQAAPEPGVVLLTGGSGYVGGRLIPLLERRDLSVRCLARDPEKLRSQVSAGTDVVVGDVLDAPSLDKALVGVHTAYYLIHLMSDSDDFEARDRLAATLFGDAAKRAGVKRIIYLGGLGDDSDPTLSPHLRSRHEVGKILRESGVETIEFRASVVIGAGSLSFELIRSLTDRLPVMLCPKWLTTPTQPIAVDDVLAYLVAARELPPGESQIIEIGGSDVVGYGDLIREYAKQTGKRRLLISVPVLSPYLSSLWLGLVTPAKASVGRHLIEGLKNPTIVHGRTARDLFPIRPMSVREAMKRALEEDAPPEGKAGKM
ncbi:MAG TPA: NAD(P)H-binding protein [Pirellulales bacterium]